jgi:hypothetical protein
MSKGKLMAVMVGIVTLICTLPLHQLGAILILIGLFVQQTSIYVLLF